MYKVQIENECACFKKSEYTNYNEFPTQQEAYKYANILAELMNEEFCGKHTFYAELSSGDSFIIKAPLNLTFVSGCSTGVSCDTGCGSNDDWSLEDTQNESCGSGCGCS